jgi:hypothetical protein
MADSSRSHSKSDLLDELKILNPFVRDLANVKLARRGDRDIMWELKLTGSGSGRAEGVKQLPATIHHAHLVGRGRL